MVAGLATFGCGGGSGGGVGVSSGGNGGTATGIDGTEFVGAYTTSTFLSNARPAASSHTVTESGDPGEYAFNVSATGVVTGRYIDEGSNTPGTGLINGQVSLNSGSSTSGSISITTGGSSDVYSGTVALSGGVLSVTLTDTENHTISFASGLGAITSGSNPFAGFYNGVFTYDGSSSTQSPANTLALIIDGSGNAFGYAVNNTTSPASTTVQLGSISSTGSATGTLSLNGQNQTSGAASGTLTLTSGVLSGTISTSTTPTTTFGITVTANS